MVELKGSKTEKHLLMAFAGESQARNRYTYYAGAARKEGFVQISDIFEETANQEKEHAKRLFKFLKGGDNSKPYLDGRTNNRWYFVCGGRSCPRLATDRCDDERYLSC